MVIRCMQRGNYGVRAGAVLYEDQVDEVVSLVGWGRVLLGEVEGVE